MPIFRAKVANLLGYGEKSTPHRKGWTRDKFLLTLDGHAVTIKQRKAALIAKRNKSRGRLVNSSTITVTKISSFDEGAALVEDLCWLLSFATQSAVVAYEFSFEKRKRGHAVMGTYNAWRPPFGNGIGKLSDFIHQTWPNYQNLKSTRPISAFIHMIGASDISGGLLENKISSSMQCLESIKSYFAIAEGAKHRITEANNGRFLDVRGKEVHFEKLLKLTLQEVGMPLPPSFAKIKALRNALIHRGFIRQTDRITQYIFGPLSPGEMHTAMFGVMEDTQDLLREYMLRLLGYKGGYWTYSKEGSEHKTIA